MKKALIYGALGVLVIGFAGGYLEYREVKAEADVHREKWEQAKAGGERLAEAMAAMNEAWQDTVERLDQQRLELEEDLADASADQQEAAEAADVVSEQLGETLAGLLEAVAPPLRPAVDTAQTQLERLNRERRDERQACQARVTALSGLLEGCEQRRAHHKARADSAVELAEARLQRALAAEDERELWKRKAQWDIVGDGPRLLGAVAAGWGLAKLTD